MTLDIHCGGHLGFMQHNVSFTNLYDPNVWQDTCVVIPHSVVSCVLHGPRVNAKKIQ